MGKLTSLLLCLSIFLLSAGCGGRPHTPPDYRASPFRAEISGEIQGIQILAQGFYSATDASVHFQEPASMEGLTLLYRDGHLSLSFEGMEADADSLAGLWELLSLPLITGELQPISLDRSMGPPLLYVQIQSEGKDRPAELWLDPESGVPHRIQKGELSLRILSFSFLSSDT